jgi:hypothetical protein
MSEALRTRITGVLAGVLRQAVRDAGATGIVLLDDRSPGGRFALDVCRDAVGEDAVARIATTADPDPVSAAERQRLAGRIEATRRRALLAHPACKTALLLGEVFPPEPLLPLGDLYASEVASLVGDCALPDAAARVAALAGGIEPLDAALRRLLEERADEDAAFASLSDAARRSVLERLQATRFARRTPGLIPKLGRRTLGIDLFA